MNWLRQPRSPSVHPTARLLGGLPTRILIADDKPQIRRLLRKLLEDHEGWSVCAEAEDGVQAIDLAEQFRPDLIILDLAMPELNGFEAARQLSLILPAVPIIMHTLYTDPQVEIEAKKCGIQCVTSKTDTRMLVQAIETGFANIRLKHEAPTILNFSPPKVA